MISSAAAIVEELRMAFPSTRAGRFVPMVNSLRGDEPQQVEADFADKEDWTRLRPEWLDAVPDGLASALSFLADEAIRFYLPAYLAADLMGALHHVDPTFALVHGLDDMSRDQKMRPRKEQTWTDFARARWDGLTQKQAAAVAHYLEWRVERDGLTIGHNIVEALGAYWYARAAGLQGFSRHPRVAP
jgi:hypothetical protein